MVCSSVPEAETVCFLQQNIPLYEQVFFNALKKKEKIT